MRFLSLTPSVFAILVLASSCGGNEADPAAQNGGAGSVGAGGMGTDGTGGASELAPGPSFATQIHPIFVQRCAGNGCHSMAPYQGASLLSVAQNDVAAAKSSGQTNIAAVLRRLDDGSMPPGGGISAEEVALIRAWSTTGFAD